MNPYVSNPKLNDWGGDRLRKDARLKFGVPPTGNANGTWIKHCIHPLAPVDMAGLVLSKGSMSSKQSGECVIHEGLAPISHGRSDFSTDFSRCI